MMSAIRTKFEQSGVGRWYAGRERNEQIVISILTALIVLSLGWLLAWKPVADWHATATNRLSNAQVTVDMVKANESALRQTTSGSSGGARGSLVQIISRGANAQGLTLNRMQPEDSGLVNVVLQEQPFDKIFAWMAQLENNNGLAIAQASFKAEEKSGYVNAQIRFR